MGAGERMESGKAATDPSTLIEYTPVESMVSAYRDALDEIRRAHDLLAAAEDRLRAVFADDLHFTVAPRDAYGVIGERAARIIERKLHRAALSAILDKLRVRPMLSEKRRRELERQLTEGPVEQLPAIDVEAIRTMVDGLALNLETYLVEAVTEVYDTLRPRGQRLKALKTNSEFGVGKKAIIYGVSCWFGKWRTCSAYEPSLIAIDNVFHLLDGKRRPAGSYYGPLVEAIMGSDGSGSTEYFDFRCCRNGNLHLTFRRLDLVRDLNVIAGSGMLRSGSGAARDEGASA